MVVMTIAAKSERAPYKGSGALVDGTLFARTAWLKGVSACSTRRASGAHYTLLRSSSDLTPFFTLTFT